jgi:membrane-bound lytic murein transglycosylase D
VEQVVSDSRNEQARDEIREYRKRREQLQENYNRFVTALNIYDTRLSEKNRLILRVARIFGESELSMPEGFSDEVSGYITKWQSSGRFARAIGLAKQKGYNENIAREFLRNDLPPQFFYLALQESDFNPYNSGPPTRKGIAKGMWQFIPETALKYGLKIGPLVDFQRADPGDERDHFDLATGAAARYIKDLYSTDAEASGLLVMACYNWGDDRVLPLVRSMPQNPKERNFWQFLRNFRERIPQETYDYVFYIVSAAVIGENPRLFGFDFDNPLSGVKPE